MTINKKEQVKKKVEIYCKNPECFNQYLATHKIKAIKIWQLSDYAWNKSQWKMIKKFIKKMNEEIEKGCRGTPANCYEIKKEINKHLGEII